MTTYTIIIGSNSIFRDDGIGIPPDPANRDYQEYLAWEAEGNECEMLPEPHPTAAEREAAAIVNAELLATVGATVAVNEQLATQNPDIIAFCQAISTSQEDDTSTAQLLNLLKTLCAGVQTLAEHDAEALSQRSGIVKLLPGAYDDLGHDAPPENPGN